MGDRYDRSWRKRPRHPGLDHLPPPPEMAWGLAGPARLGHNGGPPLDDPPLDPYVHYLWRKAHEGAWKHPPLAILRFRVARAEAAGISYGEYMAELLDSGRHLQAADVAKRRRRP